MKYEIIKDKDIFEYYVDNILPDLYSGETFYFRLITRSKYNPNIKDDIDLRCFSVDNKVEIFDILKQLEECNYKDCGKDNIGIYLNPNPRSYKLATKKIIFSLSKVLDRNINPINISYFCLRNSCSRKIYFDLDFDKCNRVETKDKVLSFINKDCLNIIPTKSGIHFLIELSKVDNIKYKDWYENISKIFGYDKIVSLGDNMLPIPGCNQFGFMPYLDNI